MIAGQALACVVDLSELGSSAARRRFMAAIAESLYEANEEPLHLVLDEADLWAPQRPIKGWEGLLGHIEEIVRRGRVRGFIPWLIPRRPAVLHKDVLSQADILIAMKLTASQDRDAIGAWIEGQADRQEGNRILGDLPRLQKGEGYLWAPRHGILERARFPAIRTFDSSRTVAAGAAAAGLTGHRFRGGWRNASSGAKAACRRSAACARSLHLGAARNPCRSQAERRALQFWDAHDLAVALGKKPTGGHWNSGIAVLRNNGLIESEPVSGHAGGRRYRAAALLRN
ncbi:MAG TPA: hypothetical protein VHT52_14465 [Stellaceae bacterium]|nr:hypothetical protein [Stellaceae bacterium]